MNDAIWNYDITVAELRACVDFGSKEGFERPLELAAGTGCIELAKRVLNGPGAPEDVIRSALHIAAESGHLAVLDLLLTHIPVDARALSSGIMGQERGVIRRLTELVATGNCPVDDGAFYAAAYAGDIPTLMFLIEQCELTIVGKNALCQHARDLRVLQWLNERGFPMREGVCEWAMRRSPQPNLDIAVWSIQKGAPFSNCARWLATKHNLLWLIDLADGHL